MADVSVTQTVFSVHGAEFGWLTTRLTNHTLDVRRPEKKEDQRQIPTREGWLYLINGSSYLRCSMLVEKMAQKVHIITLCVLYHHCCHYHSTMIYMCCTPASVQNTYHRTYVPHTCTVNICYLVRPDRPLYPYKFGRNMLTWLLDLDKFQRICLRNRWES